MKVDACNIHVHAHTHAKLQTYEHRQTRMRTHTHTGTHRSHTTALCDNIFAIFFLETRMGEFGSLQMWIFMDECH